MVPINNIQSLVQIMAWRRPGDKSLSEPLMVVYRRIYASRGLNELTKLPETGFDGFPRLSSYRKGIGCLCVHTTQHLEKQQTVTKQLVIMHRNWSVLVLVIVCCLTALIHYHKPMTNSHPFRVTGFIGQRITGILSPTRVDFNLNMDANHIHCTVYNELVIHFPTSTAPTWYHMVSGRCNPTISGTLDPNSHLENCPLSSRTWSPWKPIHCRWHG